MSTITTAKEGLAVAAQALTAAAASVEGTKGTLRDARAFRAELEAARLRAQGRIARGEVEAVPDLDRLREEFITARRAVQDAERAVADSEAELARAKKTHAAARQELGAEYAALLLEHRTALAAAVDPAIEALVATVQFYLGIARELGRLAVALNIPSGPDPEAWVSRRIFLRLRSATPNEMQGFYRQEQPVAQFDADMTKPMRQRLALPSESAGRADDGARATLAASGGAVVIHRSWLRLPSAGAVTGSLATADAADGRP